MRKLKFTNSLGFKFLSISFITCVALYIITVVGSGLFYANSLRYRYSNLCKSVSDVVAGTIDADNVDLWLVGKNTHGYIKTTNKLAQLSEDISSIDIISVYQMREDGMYTVYSTNATGVRRDLGNVVSYDSKWSVYKDKFLAGEQVDNIEVNSYSGITTMYCTPVIDSNGRCVAYVCSGIASSSIKREIMSFVKRFSLIMAAIIGVMFLLMSLYIGRKVIRPIKRIGEAVRSSVNKGSVEYMSALSSLKLSGGGEIQNILKSSEKVLEDKANASWKMNKEQRDVMNAFSTLISAVNIDMAGYTDHVSTYSRMICDQLKTKENYSGKITDEMCENIGIASALHDVGKLTIPDEILYKPGKHTKEEFEIMKTHTVNGAKIIEETANGLPRTEYLELAKEVALSHHERWDGKGYPEGLKGEEIPLSARIVMISDVFDALVTKRCYRDALAPEEAIEIMEKDEGHYDPQIFQCFLEVKDKIIEEYNNLSVRK